MHVHIFVTLAARVCLWVQEEGVGAEGYASLFVGAMTAT